MHDFNISVPQNCTNHYSQSPKILTPPPSVVQAVEGYSASVEATRLKEKLIQIWEPTGVSQLKVRTIIVIAPVTMMIITV